MNNKFKFGNTVVIVNNVEFSGNFYVGTKGTVVGLAKYNDNDLRYYINLHTNLLTAGEYTILVKESDILTTEEFRLTK